MAFFLLLFGHVVLFLVVAGVHANPRPNLTCTNDYERMFCQVEPKNCPGYYLTLRSNSGYGEKSCILEQSEQCVCVVEMTLIFGETHTATVWRGNKSVASQTIGVIESFKPKTPTITSVNKTNENFEVSWRTNMEEFSSIILTAQVIYYKKGDEVEDWKDITPARVNGLQYYEISGQHLEMSTTYVVRVRSVADMNGIASDISEQEFKTPASRNAMFMAIIIPLSLTAIIISTAMYSCYIILKSNWWDKLPNPKIPIVHPIKEMMLQPEKSLPQPVCIEQLIPDNNKQWSQVPCTDSKCSGSECSRTASSYLSFADAPVDIATTTSYNLSKLFPNISSSTASSHLSYADAPVDIATTTSYNLCKLFPNISSSTASSHLSYADAPVEIATTTAYNPSKLFPNISSSTASSHLTYADAPVDIATTTAYNLCKLFPNIRSSMASSPLTYDENAVVVEIRTPTEADLLKLFPNMCSNTASSHPSYADAPVEISTTTYNPSKLFPNLSPVSQLQTSPFTSTDSGFLSAPSNPHGFRYNGSTDLVNPSYSMLFPNSNNFLSDSPEVQTQIEMDCDFSYHSSKSDTMNVSTQDVSPLMPIDMSQQNNTDPQRFSCAEDPSLPSISSGTDTTTSCEPESRVETFASLPNKNPFHGCMLPESHSSVVMEDDYQPIQNLVAQPGVLFSEERCSDQEEALEKYEEKPFIKNLQSCLNPLFQGVINDTPGGLSQLV